MKKFGETMLFSGGAEDTPLVSVGHFVQPGSLHHGDCSLVISQGSQMIRLSPETMKAILKWYER